jgi:uncharacterized membrane protein YidH (DUF202 family)
LTGRSRRGSDVPEDIEAADPGLARARTRLAWTRSSISFAAIGVALLKDKPVIGGPVLILSAAIWSIGLMPADLSQTGRANLTRRRVQLVTAGVILIALAALAIAFLGRSSNGLKL